MASGRSSAASAPVSGGGAPSSAAADSDDEPEQLQYKVCMLCGPTGPFCVCVSFVVVVVVDM